MKIQFNIKQTDRGNYSLYLNIIGFDELQRNESDLNLFLVTFSSKENTWLLRTFLETELKSNSKEFFYNLLNERKQFYFVYNSRFKDFLKEKGIKKIKEFEPVNEHIDLDLLEDKIDLQELNESVLIENQVKTFTGSIDNMELLEEIVKQHYSEIKGNLNIKKDKALGFDLNIFKTIKKIDGELKLFNTSLYGDCALPEITGDIDLGFTRGANYIFSKNTNFSGWLILTGSQVGSLPENMPKEMKGLNLKLCNLYSLEGCPETINLNFNCADNHLNDLFGGPEFVYGRYDLDANKGLKTLEGLARVIGTDLILDDLPALTYVGMLMGLEGVKIGNRLSIDLDTCRLLRKEFYYKLKDIGIREDEYEELEGKDKEDIDSKVAEEIAKEIRQTLANDYDRRIRIDILKDGKLYFM